MSLDHYVSQVHLKKFCSPKLGDRMHAIRKSDLKAFTPTTKAVCGIHDGSTNAYLRNDRAIEDFLQTIEPNYDVALNKLCSGQIDDQCIHAIAGFVAYIITCSPTAMRLQSEPLKRTVEATAAVMDARGMLPPSPPVMGGKSLTELLAKGVVDVEIDPKYPQAIGIGLILRLTTTFGNFKWEILHNDFEDSPLFTSDYPVAIEATNDPRIVNKIIPLAPKLAIRIKPDLDVDTTRDDLSFGNIGYRTRRISRAELVKVNRLIVRCAEDTVFYRDNRSWVRPFIVKNRHYRIESYTQKLPTLAGTLQVSTSRIARNPAPRLC